MKYICLTIIFTFILLVLLLFACSKTTDPLKEFSSVKSQELKGEIFMQPEEYGIFQPRNMRYFNNWFIIMDINNKQLLHIIDAKSKKVVNGFSNGNGPGEIVSLGSVECVDGAIYVYDIARKILYRADISSSMSDTIMHYSEYMRLETEQRPFMLNQTNKGFIATGLFEDGVFMFIPPDQEKSRFFVDYPSFETTEGLEKIERAALYIGERVSIKPDQSKLACAFSNAGVISLCDIKMNEITEYKNITYFGPKFSAPRDPSLPAIIYEKDHKSAFCDIATTDEYVYLIYSGRSRDSYKGESLNECEHLLVYDWNGNPVKYYHLDIPLFSFCLDSDDNTIYGISFQPEGVIVKYKI